MDFDSAYILAYLKKELTSEKNMELEEHMSCSPEFSEKVHQVEAIYKLSNNLSEQRSFDVFSAWERLSIKIQLFTFRRRLWNVVRIAGVLLIPVFMLYQYAIKPKLTPVEMITIVSTPGIVKKTILPDGSEVWLNAQSKLIYPARFSGKERTVQLSGEAFFKVTADKEHRFNVKMADDITVSAFGTEFNIYAYPDDPEYHITLARGNIEMETFHSMKKEMLKAGQKAVWSPNSGEMKIVQADTYLETAWKDGKMIFQRERLEIIAQRLSRKFGVIIRLEGDALKDYKYTATFTDETLEDILDLLKRSAPIAYSINGQEQLNNNPYPQKIVIIKEK